MKQAQLINEQEAGYPGTPKEFVQAEFRPAPEGTTAEVYPGVFLPVKAFLKTQDNQFEIPVIEMQSDYEWQASCLNDRLKSPEKYRESGEDVEAVIAKLRKWLQEHTPN